jgi:predicted glycosyltransferase involved in capsule biosynthesis
MAQTPYAAVWDTDAIAPPKQVEEAVEYLRQSKTVMTYPYDGRFYAADKMTSNLFRQTLSYNTLITHIGTMGLMHGYHSPGGAFLVKIKEYLEAGGENENFYGWGQEDNERLKRLEFLGLPVVRANGPLFHLWHPRGQNSWFANREIEIQNRKEILKICRMRKQPTK